MPPDDLHRPGSKGPISLPKLLVVEGADQWYFLKAALQHFHIPPYIELHNYGGVTDLGPFLETLPAITGFEQVTSLGVIRDAEVGGAPDAFLAICRAIEAAREYPDSNPWRRRLTVPSRPLERTGDELKVSTFILPDCVGPGSIETLCLDSVRGNPAMQCVDDYVRCLEGRHIRLHANRDKTRLHAFLSSCAVPDFKLGEAAHAGFFPWESATFRLLREFLTTL